MQESTATMSDVEATVVRWSIGRLLKFNTYFFVCLLVFMVLEDDWRLVWSVAIWILVFNVPFLLNWTPVRLRKDGFIIWDRIGKRFYAWSDVEGFKAGENVLAFEPTKQCREKIENERSFIACLRRFLVADGIKKYRFPKSLRLSPDDLMDLIEDVSGRSYQKTTEQNKRLDDTPKGVSA